MTILEVEETVYLAVEGEDGGVDVLLITETTVLELD